MPHPSAWLPSSLEPVALRLARADHAAYNIAQLARAWSSEGHGPFSIIGVKYLDGSIDYFIESIRPIPPLLPLLFSEAVHHLRSAIENTRFYLVESERGAALPPAQAGRISMPIQDDEQKFEAWLKGNSSRGLVELGTGSTIVKRIRTLQPYLDPERVTSISDELASILGVQPVREAPLKLLQQYSNNDKHRIPVAAAQRSSVVDASGPFVGSEHVMRPRKVGDMIGSSRSGEIGIIETNAAVHVQRPSSGAWVGPARELNALRRHVADYVLPTLVKGFALPSTLPPQVDLDHLEKRGRERIEEGGWTSGDERATHDALNAVVESLQAEPTAPEIVEIEHDFIEDD